MEGATPTDDVVRNADLFPTGVGFRRQLDGEWCDVTWSGFRDDVMAIARCLVASGLASGDRVGLLSETRYEWTLLDYACLLYTSPSPRDRTRSRMPSSA